MLHRSAIHWSASARTLKIFGADLRPKGKTVSMNIYLSSSSQGGPDHVGELENFEMHSQCLSLPVGSLYPVREPCGLPRQLSYR